MLKIQYDGPEVASVHYCTILAVSFDEITFGYLWPLIVALGQLVTAINTYNTENKIINIIIESFKRREQTGLSHW